MEFRPFGRTGLKVSAIGFGCWEIGGTYGRIDESLFQRAVARAIGALGWEIVEADMAEIDTVLARHGAVTTLTGWLEDE
jgi:predicted aldo/keto reductase-like oxidoreductase